MTYKEIDRDLLIRKRRIAFELGESTLPKYAKKFIERVLDSEELTPTISEAEIRAEAVRKFAEFLEKKGLLIDMKFSGDSDWDRLSSKDVIAEYEKEQKK